MIGSVGGSVAGSPVEVPNTSSVMVGSVTVSTVTSSAGADSTAGASSVGADSSTAGSSLGASAGTLSSTGALISCA
ncbi:MAG: hypothetical protein UV44_C0025G0003 [candidate division WWE3 bacterium GW2011_GWD1_42_70]|nr:MAG: hypothetical protein UV44_C0025G0003 [candidate division WWE3 bacterium GW2011_GWD1_42_70]